MMSFFRKKFVVLFSGCIAAGITLLWMRLGGFLTLHIQKESDSFSNLLSTHPTPASMNLSDVLFPQHFTPGHSPLIRQNYKMLHSLFQCIERRDCHENQTKVVLLAAPYFRDYLVGSRGGESIWAKSTVRALDNMGYTYLYTSSPSHTVQLYRMFPDLVKILFVDPDESFRCYSDVYDCVESDANPTGIPPWKMFSFVFWAVARNPLGEKWTVSPENYDSMGLGHNTYLGYSIEETCRNQKFVPHSERENQAYILAKLLSFLTPERNAAWTQANFDAVTNATGITFMLGASNDTSKGQWSTPELPSRHINLGRIGPAEFMENLSKSRVLIGMAHPTLSPSPYDALCLGVPFINPITTWNPDNPYDKSRWQTQHYALQELDPPYVYNVFKGNTEALVHAVKSALAHPIESYVLERMTIASVEKRLAAIIEKDWQTEAELLAPES